MAKKENEFLKKLKSKYQLVVYNEESLQEAFKFRLSRMNLFSYFGLLVIVIAVLVSLLFVFTPFGLLLPSQRNSELSRELFQNAILLDSLKKEIRIRDQYFENIQNIMLGRKINNYDNVQDTSYRHARLEFTRSKHDSILRQQIEKEEKQNLSVLKNKKTGSINLKNLHFFVPVKGIVTNGFDPENEHMAIDIVAQPNEPVLATLEGTVTLATWSLTEGYIIIIQHNYNIVSIYKHNSSLLKKVGDHVTAGEPIAIIGNTGELSTGPHLHFELWYNGTPINPEDYIAF